MSPALDCERPPQLDTEYEDWLDEINARAEAERIEERIEELRTDELRGSPLD